MIPLSCQNAAFCISSDNPPKEQAAQISGTTQGVFSERIAFTPAVTSNAHCSPACASIGRVGNAQMAIFAATLPSIMHIATVSRAKALSRSAAPSGKGTAGGASVLSGRRMHRPIAAAPRRWQARIIQPIRLSSSQPPTVPIKNMGLMVPVIAAARTAPLPRNPASRISLAPPGEPHSQPMAVLSAAPPFKRLETISMHTMNGPSDGATARIHRVSAVLAASAAAPGNTVIAPANAPNAAASSIRIASRGQDMRSAHPQEPRFSILDKTVRSGYTEHGNRQDNNHGAASQISRADAFRMKGAAI